MFGVNKMKNLIEICVNGDLFFIENNLNEKELLLLEKLLKDFFYNKERINTSIDIIDFIREAETNLGITISLLPICKVITV